MSKMIITRLTLVNYTRISLSGIKKLTYTPDTAYQLQKILGTNGSGKSSILNELWPLPPDKDHFGTNGRKELCIDYNGKSYELISSFEGKPTHEFWVDGVDLNDGGKIEMFRTLAEEHFGVTNEIRSLALEYDPLDKMTPARRRYWMVKLADTDFTYAIAAYNQLRQAHRDAQGGVRRLQQRLVAEKLKLFDKDVAEGIGKEITDLKALIREIYDIRNPDVQKADIFSSKLNENDEMLESFSREIDRLNDDVLAHTGFEDRASLDERRDSVKHQIYGIQQVSQHLFVEHSRIKRKYDLLIQAGTESVAELTQKVADANETILYEEGFIALTNVKIENDPQQMKDAFTHIYHDLFDQITQLRPNDGIYTRVKAQNAEDRVSILSRELKPLEGRISRLEGEIEHRRDHIQQDAITCPECKHSWTIKATEADLKKAEEMLAVLKDAAHASHAEIKHFQEWLKEFAEYSASYRLVVATMKSNSILANYFNEITQNNRLMLFPGSVAAEMHTVMSDLDHHIEIDKQKKIVKAASEQIELKKNLDADTLENIEAEMNRLEETMAIQTKNLGLLNEESRQLESYATTDNRVALLHSHMQTCTMVARENVKGYIYTKYMSLLSEIIFSLQTQVARKEDALAAITAQEQIVADVEGQLQEAIMNEKVAKMAHEALSPTKGAIAEGLQRSVNGFVLKMNKIINSVWSYPLEILPFKMEDGQTEMDYKFPFLRNREGKPAEDVNEGSESMIDIFNFAFRVCALRQLGLDHLPLFLDEFGASFDDVHREKSIYLVKNLLDSEAFGQIFFVSHYETLHGGLNNQAQTMVVSKDNLLLPSDIVYNEHVTIE